MSFLSKMLATAGLGLMSLTSQAAPDLNNRAGAISTVPGETKLQGRLDGGGDANVTFYYGPVDGGTTAASWANKVEVKGVKSGTDFAVTASKLIFGQTYYYRAFATNASGEGWAKTSVSFTTLRPRVSAAGADKLPVKAGLVCWFDAAVGVTADDKGAVKSWQDLSGNGHDGTVVAGTPVLARNQINAKPAIQFRTPSGVCGLNLEGPLIVQQQYVVLRSPNDKWNNDGCVLGRRWKRASSYRFGQKSTRFWGDQYPKGVAKDGKKLSEPPFDMASITEFMILKIDVNDGDLSKGTYQIGMADAASCDMDVAEIMGFQTPLSPADEELVGGYLAAKYGIKTAYPANPGMTSACTLINGPATVSGPTSVTVTGTLASPGATYDVRVYWGTTDGGTDATLWENSAPVNSFTNANATKIIHTINGLEPSTTYYFTFRGTNSVDSLWADKSQSFRAGGAVAVVPTLTVRNGLACWFDAGVGVTADAKGTVQAWKDQSGKDRHAKTGGGVAPILAASQINSKPALQFRKGWLGLDGTFFSKEQFLVLRSPTAKWSGATGLFGRLKGRGSSYNTWGNDSGFWTDVSPAAVSKNGHPLIVPFDCAPLTKFMILKIIVNNANETEAAYVIGNNDGLTQGDFDVAEILAYESILSPREEALVGGYLATKYGIETTYPPLPPAKAPELSPGDLAGVKYSSWKHSGSLFLLTTPDGANLPASASEENFPVLVRLNKDWFPFNEAQPNGEDLRFATSLGVPMAFQIDQWDAAGGTASVWLRVPVIKGNARQEIKVYWGNAAAKSESSGPAVFNKSNGYLSVWHMNEPVRDDAGTVESRDLGSTPSAGIVGSSRHFGGGKGIYCGDKITRYPFASSPHTTEAWVKAEKMNVTLVEWGKGGGATLKLISSPARAAITNGKGAAQGTTVLPKSEWLQVVYTYDGQHDRIYVNGRPDMPAPTSSTIEALMPVRMQIGNGLLGDLDEVRVSNEARSADWVKLQYENQNPLQSLVGPLVQSGNTLAASDAKVLVPEGRQATVTVKAGGAQKISWIVKKGESETVVAVDRFSYTIGKRVAGEESFTLRAKAVYADGTKTLDIPVTIQEEIPEPAFSLKAPASWNGRETIEVVPAITNLPAMQAKGAGELKYEWTIPPLVEFKEIQPGKLILKRARNSGELVITAAVSNGCKPTTQEIKIAVQEPAKDAWVQRTPDKDEKPVDGQFFARDDTNEGTLFYNGTLDKPADSVFLKLYADDKLVKTETQKPAAGNAYALTAKLKAGLIKYKIEFGTKMGGTEAVMQTVTNLVCGDAYLIEGQSNALATDTGEKSPPYTSEWIRSYGRAPGNITDKPGNLWCYPVWKASSGEKAELGWWGMELAKRLLESQKMPIFIINGAVGGTRIDQHQRNDDDPTDLKSIYGRMLWRVQQAKMAHGIRGVLWHQGEADQGLDGPDGGYGSEFYQQYFLNMSADWKHDFPNLRHYYLFQIWPNACGQGSGHGDMLREVQRNLPRLYSNMDIVPTLDIKPPGSCHYPLIGWTEFAKLMQPLIERDFYGRKPTASITAPNLQRATFTSPAKDAIALEFDQPIVWAETLASQFYLDGEKDKVASGTLSGNVLTLKLKESSTATKISYLKEMNWSQDKLIIGANGIAALTFCDVPIAGEKTNH
ncbi:MAG: DUF2341 domain-containing protein [Chthoniobacter sp.]|nr:DUF2341 domain-containing protein [Chthoniobacter sp.]